MFCIPILAPDMETALEHITRAATEADILELRLDLMEGLDLGRLVQASTKPVLATYRSRGEGGRGSEDPETGGKLILSALESGAQFADMELRLPVEWRQRITASKGDAKIIVSSHFFDRTPGREELDRVYRESLSAAGDMVKIVTMAGAWEDILRVMELIPRARKQGVEITAFCMGPVGRISRVLAHLLGACLTFTSLESGRESAAGQIPVEEMKDLIRIFSHQVRRV